MAGAQHQHFPQRPREDAPFWYSPGGWNNGLEDVAWVSVLDLADSYAATIVLFELRQDGVPAYAAPIRDPRGPRSMVRLWVGASKFGAAQSSLIRVLPELIRHLGTGIVR
jgi:hypothetical protein